MTTHQVRITLDDFGPRPFKVVLVDDIDTDDYDEKNLTMGCLVWDSWQVMYPKVKDVLANVDQHDDQRVLVTFDNIYVADEFPNHVDEDLFSASWVAQHDAPLAVTT